MNRVLLLLVCLAVPALAAGKTATPTTPTKKTNTTTATEPPKIEPAPVEVKKTEPAPAAAVPVQTSQTSGSVAAQEASKPVAPVEVESNAADRAEGVAARSSVVGAAALGDSTVIAARFTASTSQANNAGTLGIEGTYGRSLSKNLDLLVHVRIPLSLFGLSPGASVRWVLGSDGRLSFALVGTVMLNLGFSTAFTSALSIRPAAIASYALTEKVELFMGMSLAYNQMLWSRTRLSTVPGFSAALNAGTSVAISSKLSVFALAEMSVGYEPVRNFIVIGDRASGVALNAGLSAGLQMSL